jgi:hypothetical protein
LIAEQKGDRLVAELELTERIKSGAGRGSSHDAVSAAILVPEIAFERA